MQHNNLTAIEGEVRPVTDGLDPSLTYGGVRWESRQMIAGGSLARGKA